MVDSENSRTLPAITRRKMFSTTVAIAAATTVHPIGVTLAASPLAALPEGPIASPPDAPAPSPRTDGNKDPALQLWLQWVKAHQHLLRLSTLQYRLAAQLADETGTTVFMVLAGQERHLCFSGISDTDAWNVSGRMSSRSRATQKARLQDRIRHHKAVDERIGYTRTVKAVQQAADQRRTLADQLTATPAQSTAGAAAKLSAFIDMYVPLPHWPISHQHVDEPASYMRSARKREWPQLTAILDDLIRVQGRQQGLFDV